MFDDRIIHFWMLVICGCGSFGHLVFYRSTVLEPSLSRELGANKANPQRSSE
ncbi:hypothetical protein CERSUDRAFT_84036 [Gelatoporia subvermispora B]|uniref:Uncharacterized protein n=1 Tax=Ceriporiopsis subvermispora (strain B) TaxID=914234 RepID=M2RDY5_CERS8|nr:hypothetical protein CERSUDRAFT_84036 [Gelatoporia subvermispora B]